MNHLTPRQEQTLSIIAKHQPISRAELSRVLQCRPKTTSQFLMHLRRAELIQPVGQSNRHDSKWVLSCTKYEQPAEIAQASSVWGYAQRCGMSAARSLTP